MDFLFSTIQPALAFLIILTVLVFVHEWGHYIVAKFCGVKVEVFSIGFGPEITGFYDRHGTRWKISWIPLGGYVKFFGDATESSAPSQELFEMSEEEKKVSFHHKNLLQKSAIVFAGPAINFIFAILIFSGMLFSYGKMVYEPIVGEVITDGAAEKAGILAGDRIIEIDGSPVTAFRDISKHLALKVDEKISLIVLRNGQNLTLSFPLKTVEIKNFLGEDKKIYQIGIRNNPEERKILHFGVIGAIWEATGEIKELTYANLTGLGQIIMGDRSAKELGGPIAIARVAGKAAEFGIVEFLNIMAMVSMGLGLINLFPIPMLDGGHLLYYAIEAVRRKKMSLKAQEIGFKIGAAVVLSLMVFVFYNDISAIIDLVG
ncbi:MAG: RIP metalloprotease RseP [Emcibacteraceae bacterium]